MFTVQLELFFSLLPAIFFELPINRTLNNWNYNNALVDFDLT